MKSKYVIACLERSSRTERKFSPIGDPIGEPIVRYGGSHMSGVLGRGDDFAGDYVVSDLYHKDAYAFDTPQDAYEYMLRIIRPLGRPNRGLGVRFVTTKFCEILTVDGYEDKWF